MSGEAMDRGIKSPFQDIVFIILQILMLPLVTLSNILNIYLPGIYGNILVYMNSLCWGVGMYFIVKWYKNRKEKIKTSKRQ